MRTALAIANGSSLNYPCPNLGNLRSNVEITVGRELMKTWSKPVVATVDAGFEVTRYLPSTLDVAAKRSCTK